MNLKAVERELIEPGWQKVFQPEGISQDGKGTLTKLEIGQRVRPKKVWAKKRNGLDEAELIRMLREKGIGRPATYALIVDALLTRKYVTREGDGQLRLTPRGREVCTFLVESLPDLFDLAYTAQMESDLDNISNGKVSYDAAVVDLWRMLKGK